MLSDGHYSAWFRIPHKAHKEGMGIVTLARGKLTGGDTVIAYSGSYVQQGDCFTAMIVTKRHSEGNSAIFGIDEVEIELEGTSKTTTASCKGRVKQCPEVPFEVVLIKIND